jgi:hypothetical protein
MVWTALCCNTDHPLRSLTLNSTQSALNALCFCWVDSLAKGAKAVHSKQGWWYAVFSPCCSPLVLLLAGRRVAVAAASAAPSLQLSQCHCKCVCTSTTSAARNPILTVKLLSLPQHLCYVAAHDGVHVLQVCCEGCYIALTPRVLVQLLRLLDECVCTA